MQAVHKTIAFFLVSGMLWSPWSGAVMPCQQAGEAGVAHHAVAIDEQVDQDTSHQHHGSAEESTQESAAHGHSATAGDESSATSSPQSECCEDCAEVCVLSGSTAPATISTAPVSLTFGSDNPTVRPSDACRVGPFYPSLFRPPISNA